jgi:hypothetical protein
MSLRIIRDNQCLLLSQKTPEPRELLLGEEEIVEAESPLLPYYDDHEEPTTGYDDHEDAI